jgi:hypothetical protein
MHSQPGGVLSHITRNYESTRLKPYLHYHLSLIASPIHDAYAYHTSRRILHIESALDTSALATSSIHVVVYMQAQPRVVALLVTGNAAVIEAEA